MITTSVALTKPVCVDSFATTLDWQRLARPSLLAALRGRAVILDVPAAQRDWKEWLCELGFMEQRVLFRMSRGDNRHSGALAETFAIAGPEVG